MESLIFGLLTLSIDKQLPVAERIEEVNLPNSSSKPEHNLELHSVIHQYAVVSSQNKQKIIQNLQPRWIIIWESTCAIKLVTTWGKLLIPTCEYNRPC